MKCRGFGFPTQQVAPVFQRVRHVPSPAIDRPAQAAIPAGADLDGPEPLVLALPKGRILKELAPVLGPRRPDPGARLRR